MIVTMQELLWKKLNSRRSSVCLQTKKGSSINGSCFIIHSLIGYSPSNYYTENEVLWINIDAWMTAYGDQFNSFKYWSKAGWPMNDPFMATATKEG